MEFSNNSRSPAASIPFSGCSGRNSWPEGPSATIFAAQRFGVCALFVALGCSGGMKAFCILNRCLSLKLENLKVMIQVGLF